MCRRDRLRACPASYSFSRSEQLRFHSRQILSAREILYPGTHTSLKMAATSNKRPLPAKVEAMKARKRQKVDQSSSHGDPTNKAKGQKSRKAVHLEKLPWKDVSLPDRMDDYEGFFGLEEIDDVEVTRDPASGKISYMTTHEEIAPRNEDEDGAAPEDQDDCDEWAGFGDDGSGAEMDDSLEKQTELHPETKPAKSERKVKDRKTKDPKPVSEAPNGIFGDLEAADDAEDVDVSAWLPLKLSPDTLSALARLNFSKPTSIQTAAIPDILAGHDVIGKASTGSGKTLAFGIPILESFLEKRHTPRKDQHKSPLALIISPTRELAHQLCKHLTALCSSGLEHGPSIATITGGLSAQKQQRQIKDADIIIGTPGRLWEVISDGHGLIRSLRQVQFLVVDEADRLLSAGHYKELEEILIALDRKEEVIDDPTQDMSKTSNPAPVERQTLVFSATFDRGLQKKLAGKAKPGGDLMSNKESMEYLLAKLNFREEKPKFIDVNPVSQMATGLKEGLIECAGTEKDLYLYSLLLHYRNARTLVFTNSISAVRRITPFLQNLELPALALHSGMIQKARLRSVERFSSDKSNNASILIATDVAARGLDIPNVQLVVHYHLPRAADMYVHRSGRTARAGQQGSSILICGPEEAAGVRRLVAKVHAQSALTHDQSASDAAKQGYYIRTLDMDRRIVSRLRPRAQLAKKLADVQSAKEKQHKEDDFMRAAAEELGVDYDSEEFEKEAPGRHGRGAGRKKKERQAREVSKAEASGMRAELRELLKQRINVGVSEKYITSGRVDVDELLRQQEAGAGKTGEFLGGAGGLGLEDI